ncbi:MAG: flagellar export protein FliJ [Sulfurimonas sp.]|jgi:flagellar export protein FliJ
MKTRFSSLVAIKKDAMQKRERELQQALQNHERAKEALHKSLKELQNIEQPNSGSMSQLLANRTLLSRQRAIIQHNEEWLEFTKNEVQKVKETLKEAMIEYEKFKYLELQEIEKVLKAQKQAEVKRLDEIALMTFGKKETKRKAS